MLSSMSHMDFVGVDPAASIEYGGQWRSSSNCEYCSDHDEGGKELDPNTRLPTSARYNCTHSPVLC